MGCAASIENEPRTLSATSNQVVPTGASVFNAMHEETAAANHGGAAAPSSRQVPATSNAVPSPNHMRAGSGGMFGRLRTSTSRGGALRESIDHDDKVAMLLKTIAKMQQQIEMLTGDGEALRGQLRIIQTGQSNDSGSVQSSSGWGAEHTIASRTSTLENQTQDLNQRLVRLDKSVAEIKDYVDDQRSAAEFSKQLRVIEESGMIPPNMRPPRCSSPASSIRSSVYGGPFDDHGPYVGGLLPAPSFPQNRSRALPPVGVGAGREGRRRMDPGPSNRPYTGGPPNKPGVGAQVRASHGAPPRISPAPQPPMRPPALAAIPSGWEVREVPSVVEARAGRRAVNSPSTSQHPQGARRVSPSPSGNDTHGHLVEATRDSFSALMAAVSVAGAPPSPPPLARLRPSHLLSPSGQIPGSIGTPTGVSSQHGIASAW